jgi:hypothetical protein
MKSEPKSIFTSYEDLGSQPSHEQTPPSRPSSLSRSVPSPPSPVESYIAREADLGGSQTDSGSSRTNPIAAIRRKANPEELDPSEYHGSISFNATSEKSTANPTIEPTSFRKPDLPVTHAQLHQTPKAAQASKHPRPDESGPRPVSTERAPKRTRPRLKPRHTLDPETFQAATATISHQHQDLPPSPLFFSHSRRQRPSLTPAFSSSVAAATMMNKARDEPGGVTTLKLARGSISSIASPPRLTNIPGNLSSFERTSFDRRSTPRSPDPNNKLNSGMQILYTVGIVELLEQDERPTFIIDVADPTNFIPGPLQLVFANASLRAHDAILEMIAGKPDLESPGIGVTNDFPEFKAWALSFVKNGESLDICLPSFIYGGITWTCSTLRKRLRLISGTSNTATIGTGSGSSNGALSSSSIRSERMRGAARSTYGPSPLSGTSEPADYFGDAAPPLPSTEVVPPHEVLGSPRRSDDSELARQVMLASQSDVTTSELMRTPYPESPSFDWTRLPMSAALPRHIQFARSIDWASTPLGPIEDWSFDLRAMCNLIMGSPHPAAMYWGPEYIAIYNEAYILLAGQKHPQLMVRFCAILYALISVLTKLFTGSELQSCLG